MWNLCRSCSCPVSPWCNYCNSFSWSMICRTCSQWFQTGRFVLDKNLKSCLTMVTLAQVLGAFSPASWMTWILDQAVYGFHVFFYPLLWQGEAERKALEASVLLWAWCLAVTTGTTPGERQGHISLCFCSSNALCSFQRRLFSMQELVVPSRNKIICC